jgi:hypothetical protein
MIITAQCALDAPPKLTEYQMRHHARLLLANVCPGLVVCLMTLGSPAQADDCLTAPNLRGPQTGHWYYRLDRQNNRKCWYVGAAGRPARQASIRRGKSVRPKVQVARREAPDNTAVAPIARTTEEVRPAQPPALMAMEPASPAVAASTTGAPEGFETRWPSEALPVGNAAFARIAAAVRSQPTAEQTPPPAREAPEPVLAPAVPVQASLVAPAGTVAIVGAVFGLAAIGFMVQRRGARPQSRAARAEAPEWSNYRLAAVLRAAASEPLADRDDAHPPQRHSDVSPYAPKFARAAP